MNVRLFKTISSITAGIAILFAVVIPEASAKLRVVTSFSQDSSIVKAIGGDRIRVVSLTTGVQNPHAVQAKPSLAVHLSEADLLIVNGQQMEIGWLPAALASSGNPRIQEGGEGYLNASVGTTLTTYADHEIEGTNFISSAKDHKHKIHNHHYWLDPANGLVIAENIYKKLAQMDPANAVEYEFNYAAFSVRLSLKIKDWDTMMAAFKGAKIVSYHRDWTYLANRHGLHVAGYIEPRETIPPSARDVAVLVKLIQSENIPLILISPWQPQRISREIARQSGATVLSLPSGVDPRLGARDYIQLFDVIYSQLARALSS